jgi:tRNA-dihydrouridine synthase
VTHLTAPAPPAQRGRHTASPPAARPRAAQDHAAHRADWAAIAAVVAALRIPVLANGDVRCLADARALMAATGAAGVLSAEPLLHNPALFATPTVRARCV